VPLGKVTYSVLQVLGGLRSLFMLSFKSNAVTCVSQGSLSPTIGWLILTDNRITELPDDISKLTGLRKVTLTVTVNTVITESNDILV